MADNETRVTSGGNLSIKTLKLQVVDPFGVDGPRIVSEGYVVAPGDAHPIFMQAQLTWNDGDVSAHKLMLWSDVEQIAEYVRGDGSDAQRQALADGILEGRKL